MGENRLSGHSHSRRLDMFAFRHLFVGLEKIPAWYYVQAALNVDAVIAGLTLAGEQHHAFFVVQTHESPPRLAILDSHGLTFSRVTEHSSPPPSAARIRRV